MRELAPEERWAERRLLIRLPNWIGDAVMAAPAVQALARARPDWEWVLAGGPRSLPLFLGLDEPFRHLSQLESRHSRPAAFARAALRARGARLDAALLLPPSFSAAHLAAWAAIPVRYGWPTDRRRALLTHTAGEPVRTRPLRDQYLELAEGFLDLLDPDAAPHRLPRDGCRLPLTVEEIDWASRWWSGRGWDPEETIALAPGATFGLTKRWPEDRFLALAESLVAEGRRVLWIGGADERDLCTRLAASAAAGAAANTARSAEPRSVSVAAAHTIRETLALLSRVRGAVTNDSGALHLAQAAGCPVVGIFGSTSPLWTGPGGESGEVVYDGIACSPCFDSTCPTHIECLTGIGVPRVQAALVRLLERTARRVRRRAVFLDRDGTVCELVPYLSRPEQVALAPGAADGMRRLQEAGFALVVVTNQSAIARGWLDPVGLHRVHLRLREILLAEGIHLDAVESCPHHPEFTGPCLCRKPEPGMLLRAALRCDLDLARSFALGDSPSDLEAGARAGAHPLLVRSGYGRETEARWNAESAPGERPQWEASFEDLSEAASWILSRPESGSRNR